MKKAVALAAFAAVAAAATFSYAGLPARTGVNGSLHDMNAYNAVQGRGQQDVYNRVCVFCHTPHNATVLEPGYTDSNYLPLWGNFLTEKDQQQHAYQWATPANLPLTEDVLTGPSRLCMTCHDGTLAIDAHTSNGGATTPGIGWKLTGSRAIGSSDSELNTTHPIGFSWSAAMAARNLPKGTKANQVDEIALKDYEFATSVTASGTAGTYNTVVRDSNRTIGSVLYQGDIMTCASCHEVHNKENAVQADPVGGGTAPNYFLYAQEKESLICLSCHIK